MHKRPGVQGVCMRLTEFMTIEAARASSPVVGSLRGGTAVG